MYISFFLCNFAAFYNAAEERGLIGISFVKDTLMANESKNNKSGERGDVVLLSDLRYSDVLSQFGDVIGKEFKFDFDEMYVYRTSLTTPPTDIDTLPKHRRDELTMGKPYEFEYTPEEIAEMDYEEKKGLVTKEGMSVHQTLSKAISEAKRAYRKQKERLGEEAGERFIVERGSFIMRLRINNKVGLISDFHRTTKHANVLLKEGVTIEDILDKEFEIVEFSYKEE